MHFEHRGLNNLFLKICYVAIVFLKIYDSQQYSKIEYYKESISSKILNKIPEIFKIFVSFSIKNDSTDVNKLWNLIIAFGVKRIINFEVLIYFCRLM